MNVRCVNRRDTLNEAQRILAEEFGMAVSLNRLNKALRINTGRKRKLNDYANMFRDYDPPEPADPEPDEPEQEPFSNAGAQTDDEAFRDSVAFAVVNEDTDAVDDWHDKNPEPEPKGYLIEDYLYRQKMVHGQNNNYHGFIPKDTDHNYEVEKR
jgi:hypothetical protein